MHEEFKLCWKNFQDNIASGFQNLYDHGNLVDVTLACEDGKLLQAHKIVLAICSPYFQEIFIKNPCKHPIIILKDVTFNIMCELLEFMYQGVVNVKQAELQSFMKIGQLLQIKGLALNSSSSAASTSSEKSTSQTHNVEDVNSTGGDGDITANIDTHRELEKDEPQNHDETNAAETTSTSNKTNINSTRSRSPNNASTTPPPFPGGLGQQQANFKTSSLETNASLQHVANLAAHHAANAALKRQATDYSSSETSSPLFSRKQLRRSIADHNSDLSDANESATGMDAMNTEDFLLPTISMVESRYDLSALKREGGNAERDYRDGASAAAAVAAASLRNTFVAPFGLDYNFYKNSNNASSGGVNSGGPVSSQTEYPNDLHMANDYSKNFGNHMDIPSIAPGEHWFQGNLEFMLSQRGKPLLVHDGHTFGIQYVRKDKKYWQCNLSRKFSCKARVTTTDNGEIIVTNNEHCHTEIRPHLRKDYQRQKVMMNALLNLSTNRFAENLRRQHHQANSLSTSLSTLQQSLTAPQAANNGAPMAAHRATNSASMQHLLDLGKLSPADQATLSVALQKQEDDCEDDVPLDCGIRSTVLKDETSKDSTNTPSNTPTSHLDNREQNMVNAEAAANDHVMTAHE